MLSVFCAGGCIAVGVMLLVDHIKGDKTDE